jgi:uncharacterized membrane protein
MKYLLLLALFCLVSCLPSEPAGGESVDDCISANTGNPNATYAYVKSNIIDAHCISCHGSSGGWSAASYESILKKVDKGDYTNSRIYMRAVLGSPSAMPPTGTVLTTTEEQALADWIDDCAPSS